LRNCRIDQFKRKPFEWTAREEGLTKKKHLFGDILNAKVDVKPVAAPEPTPVIESLKKPVGDTAESASEPKVKKSKKKADAIDALFDAVAPPSKKAKKSKADGTTDTKSKKKNKA
jgi:hypothetical protein